MKIIVRCEHCGTVLGEFSLSLYMKFPRGVNANRKIKLFCNEECYTAYQKQFEVEIYNNKPIYCVPSPEGMMYIPYWECYYGFKTTADCKRRMDAKVACMLPER